jgi:hypothetical protein
MQIITWKRKTSPSAGFESYSRLFKMLWKFAINTERKMHNMECAISNMAAGTRCRLHPGYRMWRGTRWRCWLSRKVAGSISSGVTAVFNWHISSVRTMVLGSTQPLTETSTRNTFWGRGKAGRCVGLTILRPSCADVSKSGSLNPLENSGSVIWL